MHLFLTSSPCDNDVPAGVDLPCIFFERNGFVENMRDRVPENAQLAVICADPDAYELNDEMAKTFANCFEYHGMMISDVWVCDRRTCDEAADMIPESDIILLGGGHVPTENEFFAEINLRMLLEDFEGVVMGVSAGSMNCAEVVYAQPEMPGESFNPTYRRFMFGLGLTEINILPHYQKVKDMILDGDRLYEEITFGDSVGRAFVAMPDGSYILEENGVSLLFGEGYLVAEGRMEKICEEDEVVEL